MIASLIAFNRRSENRAQVTYRASLGKSIVPIEVEWRSLVNLYRITGGHFVYACVNIGCWSATDAFLWIVYVLYQHFQAGFWSWITCIGCYLPQTCSLRYRGITTMKVSLLKPRCRPWQNGLSFRKTVRRRQDGGWMFLPPNISRTFFEQEEKVSMIVFR